MFNQSVFTFGAAAGGDSTSAGGGISSINGATGPAILFAGVSGIFVERQSNTIYIAHSGIQVDLTSSGFLTSASFAGDRVATWFFAQYNHDSRDFDHAYFMRQQSQITDVTLYGNSPSGNFIVNLSSGFPGLTPTPMYVGNPKPTISGLRQVSSGLLPDTVTLPKGSILYATIENIPVETSGVRLNVHFDSTIVASGFSGIISINSQTGPAIQITGQSGVIVTTGINQIFINTSGLLTQSDLLYPVDARAVSGHIAMNASGQWNYGSLALPGQTIYANSGVFTSGVYVSGLPVPTQSQITTSGYVRHVDMLVSGYLRHGDLLASGYVRNINGLSHTPTIVGSGGVTVWIDGTTIQIGAASGSNTPESDQYPVDARDVSGHIKPSVANDLKYDLGQFSVGAGNNNRLRAINVGSGDFWPRPGTLGIPVNPNDAPAGITIHSGGALLFNNPSDTLTAKFYARGTDELRGSGWAKFNLQQFVGIGVGSAVGNGVLEIFASEDKASEQLRLKPAVGQTAKALTVYNQYDDRKETCIGSSGELWAERRRITSEYQLEFVGNGPLSSTSGLDGGRMVRHASEILDIICWTRSPSGNVIFGLSSGLPGQQPRSLYTTNSKPTASGDYAIASGSLPNTVMIPMGTILYADIHAVPSGSLANTASGCSIQVFLARQTEVL